MIQACRGLLPVLSSLPVVGTEMADYYEFYYTSDPLPASTEPVDAQISLNSSRDYYDLKWAKLDCIAFGSACTSVGIQSFPTIILFKDGKEFKRQQATTA